MKPNLDMSTVTRYFGGVEGVTYEFSKPFAQEAPSQLARHLSKKLGYAVDATANGACISLTTKTPPNGSIQTFWRQVGEACKKLGMSATVPGSVEAFGELDELPKR